MEFRVATWNVCRQKPSDVWDQLNPNPDVLLLQETSLPESEKTGVNIYGQNIGDGRTWGSAIVSRKYELNPVKLEPDSHPGAVVVADLTLPNKPSIQLISMYGLMIKGYSITTLHRMLSDLTPLIDNFVRKNIILAGDFNASLQWDEKQTNNSHKVFFDRIQDFGFVDCLSHFHPSPVQTWRNPKNQSVWQLDYFFISKPLIDNLKSCNVIEHDISDHYPIVAVFDL